jgi:hypothetical protein
MHYPFFFWNRRCRRDQKLAGILTAGNGVKQKKSISLFFSFPLRATGPR